MNRKYSTRRPAATQTAPLPARRSPPFSAASKPSAVVDVRTSPPTSPLLRMAAFAVRAHDWRVADVADVDDPGRRRWRWRCFHCGAERTTFPGCRPPSGECA